MERHEPRGIGAEDLALTDAARELLAAARDESDRLQHEYVGTEHLALALTQDPRAAETLARWGVDRERVRAMIDEKLVPGRAVPPSAGPRPYTSRTRESFAFAAESARAAGHPRVGVEHLVAGMLRERMNFGAQILQGCGLTPEQADAHVRALGDAGR